MDGRTLGIAIIGAGRIGKVHAENLAFHVPNARPLMVVDPDARAARDVAARCRIPRVGADCREALENKEVEAVLVCTPTNTHAAILEQAADAGKHIFCEKPIALDLATIDRALAAVERARVKLQVGFNRRFDANFARVRRAVASGEIGAAHLIHIISRDPAPPPIAYVRASGGMFLDMTIHDFDMVRFLIGAEVEEVYTQAAVMCDPAIGEAGDVDTAVIVLTFANGVIGTIDNSRRSSYGYDQRVEVLGDRGAIHTTNNYPHNAVVSDGTSIRRDLPFHFFMDRYTESFRTEVSAFVEAVLRDAPTPVTGADGRAPVVMALAARKSYEEHRPVRLSEIDTQTP